MIIYNSISEYIGATANIEARLMRVEAAIDALTLKLLDTTGNADIKEYQLDDGQTKIRTVYANVADVERGLIALERMKQTYINQLTGRVSRLRDGSNFN